MVFTLIVLVLLRLCGVANSYSRFAAAAPAPCAGWTHTSADATDGGFASIWMWGRRGGDVCMMAGHAMNTWGDGFWCGL